MKKIILLCLSMLLLTFYGCKEEEDPILRSYYYYYNIAIAFENQSGENLVEGIPYDESSNSILNTEYKQTISVSPDESGFKPNLYRVNEPGIWKDENGEENFFFTAMMYNNIYPMVTQKLVCPHIFGDNNEHVLVSYWKSLSAEEYTCTRFTLDGKEYPIVKEGVLKYKDGIGGDLYKVKIVLE